MTSAVPDRTPPPSPEELSTLPEFPAGGPLRLDLAGLVIELQGLPQGLLAEVEPRYARYLAPPEVGPRPDLLVAVRDAGRPHFIPPSPEPAGRLYRLGATHEYGELRLVAHGFAGWLRPAERRGLVALCGGSFDPPPRALENFLRVAVAWAALERGGFLIHSASILRDGLGYLFFGASGAGKSTIAAISREGMVVSDDLTLVLPDARGRLCVAGSPFRGTYAGGEPVVGLHPIHSAYRLRQDARTYVERPPATVALAELLANLTFVVDQVGRVDPLADAIEERLRSVPTYDLHFRMDPGFWRAIEEFHAGSSS